MTRNIIKDIEKDIAKQAKINPKRFWRYVNANTKTKEGVSLLLKPNSNDTTTNNQEKAEVLLDHFCSVFTEEPMGQIPQPRPHIFDTPLHSFEITKEMVENKFTKVTDIQISWPR